MTISMKTIMPMDVQGPPIGEVAPIYTDSDTWEPVDGSVWLKSGVTASTESYPDAPDNGDDTVGVATELQLESTVTYYMRVA